MQKWIQHAEKPLGHLDYTQIITQIYGSNNFLSDFKQMSSEKIVEEPSFHITSPIRDTNCITHFEFVEEKTCLPLPRFRIMHQ
jgi:hypothetical protein